MTGLLGEPWSDEEWEAFLKAHPLTLNATVCPDVPELADRWLEIFQQRGLPSKRQLREKPPRLITPEDPLGTSTKREIYPAQLDNGQTVWLRLRTRRVERGYESVAVLIDTVRPDEAIIAALTTLQGSRTEDRTNFALALLAHYREGFDDLAQDEKLALAERVRTYADELSEALRKLMTFLEYGSVDRKLRSAAETAQRDVTAAQLKDVEGLSYVAVGDLMGIPSPEKYRRQGDHPTVREMVRRGRRLLERALGADGWRRQAEAMRAEREWFMSLDEKDQEEWMFARGSGGTAQEARKEMERMRHARKRKKPSGGSQSP